MSDAYTFDDLSDLLLSAKRPEDAFGYPGDLSEAGEFCKDKFRSWAKVVHVDADGGAHDPALAAKVFDKLVKLKDEALLRIRSGVYGTNLPTPVAPKTSNGPVVLRSKKAVYTVGEPVHSTTLSTYYRCQWGDNGSVGLLKMVNRPQDNDLARVEARQLVTLAGTLADKALCYVPEIVDSFDITGSDRSVRHAVVVRVGTGGFCTAQAAAASNLSGRAAAWMTNRILEGLFYVHQVGVINAAVLLPNILFRADDHGGILLEWSFAVPFGGDPLGVIDPQYKSWYPPEVFRKMQPTSGLDLFMAGQCIKSLFGGKGSSAVPVEVDRIVRACMIQNPARRESDAGQARLDFRDAFSRLYGKRKFEPLKERKDHGWFRLE